MHRLILSASTVALLAACASPMMSRPFDQSMLPGPVQVPAGHKVAMETVGVGQITYECRAKANMPGQFEWVFAGPDAKLMDRNGKQVGKYYGPPATWESMDGSKLTATQLAVAPGGTGNIPMQLVKANPAMGMGAMQGVSYIQRVATKGGVAPAMPCAAANAGAKQRVVGAGEGGGFRDKQRDERGGGDVHPVRHAVHAEEHHAEERRLEEERRQHLVGHQRPDHRTGLVGEHRPVGAELVGHDDARHHAHAERDREQLLPVVEQVEEDAAARRQPEPLEHGQVTGEADRNRWKNDMEAHREGELQPGQRQGVEFHGSLSGDEVAVARC